MVRLVIKRKQPSRRTLRIRKPLNRRLTEGQARRRVAKILRRQECARSQREAQAEVLGA